MFYNVDVVLYSPTYAYRDAVWWSSLSQSEHAIIVFRYSLPI